MNDERILCSSEIYADMVLAKYGISPEGNPTNDEAIISEAAYHTQQAVEKYLKFYLRDVYGEDETQKRFRIHNISTLATRLADHGHQVSQEIIDNADELSEWEANSRYGHSVVTTREKISEMLDLLDTLLEEVKSKEVELLDKTSK